MKEVLIIPAGSWPLGTSIFASPANSRYVSTPDIFCSTPFEYSKVSSPVTTIWVPYSRIALRLAVVEP